MPSVLQGVVEQIEPDLPQQGRIGPRHGQVAHPKIHLPIRRPALDLVEDFSHQRRHVGVRQMHVMLPQPREVEQVVDQPAHALGLAADHGQHAPALFVQLRSMLLLEDAGEAVHRPQRRPQVVRDRAGEGFQFLVRGFQLRGSLADPLLQGFVQLQRAGLTLLQGFLRRPVANDPRGGQPQDTRERGAVEGFDRPADSGGARNQRERSARCWRRPARRAAGPAASMGQGQRDGMQQPHRHAQSAQASATKAASTNPGSNQGMVIRSASLRVSCAASHFRGRSSSQAKSLSPAIMEPCTSGPNAAT